MIAAPERDDVKAEIFGAVVVGCAEFYIKCNPARALSLHAGDNSFEFGLTWLDAGRVDVHLLDGVDVYQVEADTPVH